MPKTNGTIGDERKIHGDERTFRITVVASPTELPLTRLLVRVHTYVHADAFSCDIRLNRFAFRGAHTTDTLPAYGNANAAHKRQFPRQMRRCGGWVVLIMPDDGSYKPPYVGKAAHRYAKVTHRAQFKWRIPSSPLPPSRIFERNMFHRVPARASCASNFEYFRSYQVSSSTSPWEKKSRDDSILAKDRTHMSYHDSGICDGF